MITMQDAKQRIEQQLIKRSSGGASGVVTGVNFVLCEDLRTVMIYVDCADEHDAVAASFDWPAGIPFDVERCALAYHDQPHMLH